MEVKHHPNCNEKCEGDKHFLKSDAPNLEVRNSHSISDGATLLSVARDSWMIVGKPPRKELLRRLFQ